jgi:hypothetical protein
VVETAEVGTTLKDLLDSDPEVEQPIQERKIKQRIKKFFTGA